MIVFLPANVLRGVLLAGRGMFRPQSGPRRREDERARLASALAGWPVIPLHRLASVDGLSSMNATARYLGHLRASGPFRFLARAAAAGG